MALSAASQARSMWQGHHVAIIRDGEWDCTQAVPRALDALRELGIRATIFCWDLTGKAKAREVIEGHQIVRFRRYVPPRSIKIFLSWPIWWAWLSWHLLRGRFTVIHAMNVSALPPALLAKALRACRVIYDLRDALGMVLANVRWPVPQIFRAFESTLASGADGILLSQGNIRPLAEYFGRRVSRTKPVVQMLNVPMIDPPAAYRTPTGRPLRINVSGYISPARGAKTLLEAFAGSDAVVLDIVGEIRYESIRKKLSQMPNATLYGRVPYRRALELMDQADLVWLHYDNSLTNVAIASANKMFEAMMLGKPYLTADGSWMEQVAREHGLGWSVPYGDVEAIRQLIERLNANPGLLVEAGLRGRNCFLQHYAWLRQRANLVALYRYVVGRDPRIGTRPLAGWSLAITPAAPKQRHRYLGTTTGP